MAEHVKKIIASVTVLKATQENTVRSVSSHSGSTMSDLGPK